MTKPVAIIALALAAVAAVALASSQIAQPTAVHVAFDEELDTTVPDHLPASVRTVTQLRDDLDALRLALPAARSRALAELPVPESAELLGQKVPLDRPAVREALNYELLLTCGRPLMPMLWMRRAPNVEPMIERKLAAAGLPADLKYVAMIESDYRSTARSPAGAAGLWQFVRATGRRYGLRVDRYLDMRLSPEEATDAALRHLADLHDEFDDWYLALAAYNAGERRVRQALKGSSSRSYFDLYLPAETRRYVHRVLAAKLITSDPEAYGIVEMQALHTPRYRNIEVHVKRSRADLHKVAAENGLDYAALRLANPQLRRDQLPRGKHRLRIPRQ